MIARLPVYLLAAIAGLYGFAPISDGDLFWNLNVGQWMLEHLALLPAADPFTYNAQPGGVQHEWLLQVLFAAVDMAAGHNGLRLLGALTAASCVLLCDAVFRRHGASAAMATVGTALWWIVVEPHAVLRPHLLAWLFALWVLGWRFAGPTPKGRSHLLSLFVVCVVWSNAHASVLVAPLYAAIATVGTGIAVFAGRSQWHVAKMWAERASVAFVAALCTPAGWHLVPYALSTPAINRELSFEWWPLLREDVWLSRPTVLIVWSLLAVAVVCVAAVSLRRGSRLTFPGALVSLAALTHAALTRRMTAFLFLPLLYVLHKDALPFVAAKLPMTPKLPAAAAWSSLILVAVLHGPAARSSLRAEPLVKPAFPFETTAFAREAKLTGRLFNPDGWGGYIAYRLPGQQVFADGRWPLVGREVVHDGFEIMLRRNNIAPLLDKYAIDWAILRESDYLRVPGPDPKQWALAWRDGTALVLLRRTPRFADNLSKVCAFYRKYDVPDRARWHVQVTSRTGVISPTAVPSALVECLKTERN